MAHERINTALKIEAARYRESDGNGGSVVRRYPEVALEGVTVRVIPVKQEVTATVGERTEYVREADYEVSIRGNTSGQELEALRNSLRAPVLSMQCLHLQQFGITIMSVQEYHLPEANRTQAERPFSITALPYRMMSFQIESGSGAGVEPSNQ